MNVKPGEQLRRPLKEEDDALTSVAESKRPVGQEQLMEHMLERENLMTALKRVAPETVHETDFISRTAVVRDPYARWCGRSGVVRLRPIPIRP